MRETVEKLAPFLPEADPVEAAFAVTHGPRPGIEALLVLPAPIIGSFAGSLVAKVIVSAIVGAGLGLMVQASRRKYYVAVTPHAVYLVGCRRLGTRPTGLAATFGTNRSITGPTGSGDNRVIVAGTEYWVTGNDADEARRVSARMSKAL